MCESIIKLSRVDAAFLVFIIFAAGFVIGTSLAPKSPMYSAQIIDERTIEMILPAVDSDGNGVIARLYTTVKPGTGKILLDTSDVLNYPDTQVAGRTAAHVAAQYANVNLNTVDVVYAIKVNASIIEGPSSGAAMALSVIIAMKNMTTPHDIAITGTIEEDGSIGRVGLVPEKANAVKGYGITTFLVPEGQMASGDSKRVKTCSLLGSVKTCKVTYSAQATNLGESLNISVYEVRNIAEAFSYFNMSTTNVNPSNVSAYP